VAKTDVFARVRKIGLAMPDVESSIGYDGSEVLKAGGSFMAGIATDESAEADTLVVRCELDDRELLLEDAPDTYYVTDYYQRYPLVLVRLSRIDRDALRDLLSVSRRLTLPKARRGGRVKASARAISSSMQRRNHEIRKKEVAGRTKRKPL